jgi:hypothetical protein
MTNTTPYYVIRRPTVNRYCGGEGDASGYPWQLTAKTARRFSAVYSAAVALINLKGASDKAQYEIVRVEETPGTSTTVITHQTKLDATKPCVVVVNHSRSPNGGNRFATDTFLVTWTSDICKGHVFPDLGEALLAWANRGQTTWALANAELKVFNVAVVKAEPTITETVLK